MAAHAPYIMPDGRMLASVLRAEAGSQETMRRKKRPTAAQGKLELFKQLEASKRSAVTEQELAEIRAIERVGHRRRRQWLNDKLLRDLSGPLTGREMEALFNPVPFGSHPPPSAFMQAAESELWSHFRSISPDKEATVLERWELHNQQQRQQARAAAAAASSSGPEVVRSAHQQQAAAAAAAVANWGRVDRGARAALKKASVHSVLELEVQVLQLLEQDEAAMPELLLELPDPFARLLVHGLGQFHALLTATKCDAAGTKCVLLQRRQQPHRAQHEEQPQQPGTEAMLQQTGQRPGDVAPSVPQQSRGVQRAGSSSRVSATQDSAVAGAPARGAPVAAGGAGDGCAAWLERHQDITCTDVVMALKELGAAFDRHTLSTYMRTVHGTNSEVASEREYVLV